MRLRELVRGSGNRARPSAWRRNRRLVAFLAGSALAHAAVVAFVPGFSRQPPAMGPQALHVVILPPEPLPAESPPVVVASGPRKPPVGERRAHAQAPRPAQQVSRKEKPDAAHRIVPELGAQAAATPSPPAAEPRLASAEPQPVAAEPRGASAEPQPAASGPQRESAEGGDQAAAPAADGSASGAQPSGTPGETGTGGAEGGVAWYAHIAGFVAGMLLIGFFKRKDVPFGRGRRSHYS